MRALAKAIEAFLEEGKVRGTSASSLHLYRVHLASLESALRSKRQLPEITPADLDAWSRDLYRKGLSAGVRRARSFLVKRFFSWLKERNEILHDPAANLEVPRKENPLPRNPPDAKAVDRLLKKMPSRTPIEQRNRAMVEVLYGCMVRISELISLDLSDVDLDERFLVVRKGKGGRDRVLPMPERTAALVAKYLKVRHELLPQAKPAEDAKRALFLSRRGRRLNCQAIRERLLHIGRLAGLDGIHPHLLRHAGAVHMLRGKADIRHVQEILGHVELETTKEYLRLVPGDLKEAYDAAFPVLEI